MMNTIMRQPRTTETETKKNAIAQQRAENLKRSSRDDLTTAIKEPVTGSAELVLETGKYIAALAKIAPKLSIVPIFKLQSGLLKAAKLDTAARLFVNTALIAATIAGATKIELPKSMYGDIHTDNLRAHGRIHKACLDPIVTQDGPLIAASYIAHYDEKDGNKSTINEHIKTAHKSGTHPIIARHRAESETNGGLDVDARSKLSPHNTAENPWQFLLRTKIYLYDKHLKDINFGDNKAAQISVSSLVKNYKSIKGNNKAEKDFWKRMNNFQFLSSEFDALKVVANSTPFAGQIFSLYLQDTHPEYHISQTRNDTLEQISKKSGLSYLSHVLGKAGANNLKKHYAKNPDSTLRSLNSNSLRRAYLSNKHLFPKGMNTTVREIHDTIIAYGSKGDKKVNQPIRNVMEQTKKDFGTVDIPSLCRYGTLEKGEKIKNTSTIFQAAATWVDTKYVTYLPKDKTIEKLTLAYKKGISGFSKNKTPANTNKATSVPLPLLKQEEPKHASKSTDQIANLLKNQNPKQTVKDPIADFINYEMK